MRQWRWVSGVAAIVAGCASFPAQAPGDVRLSDPGGVTVGPSVVPSPGAPDVVEASAPCVPNNGAYQLAGTPAIRVGLDAVLLWRCSEAFVQHVGEAPTPWVVKAPDLAVVWVASDGRAAIGTRVTLVDGEPFLTLGRQSADGAWEVFDQGVSHGATVAGDGHAVAYWRSEPAEADGRPVFGLYWRDLATGEKTLVTRALGNDLVLNWSPDGRKLQFSGQFDAGYGQLGWAEDGRPHLLDGEPQSRYIPTRAAISWSGDSDHLLIYDQNWTIPGKNAAVVTLDLAGALVDQKPLVGQQGEALTSFAPLYVSAGNPLVIGIQGILDPATGGVRALPTGGTAVGWASEPGKLLWWQSTPEGPVLDTVPAP